MNGAAHLHKQKGVFKLAYMSKWFGCCAKYVECSDALCCLENPEYSKFCFYRQNLESGKIFYGKNKNIDNPEAPPQTFEPVNKIYLLCYNMLFSITRKSQRNLWSYKLKPEQINTIITLFNNLDILPYMTVADDSKCIIDGPTEEDPGRANSRVIIKIGDEQYSIYNYNYYLFKAWRAGAIAKSLAAKGIDARAETVGGSYNNKSIDKPAAEKPKIISAPTASEPTKQMTLFDM